MKKRKIWRSESRFWFKTWSHFRNHLIDLPWNRLENQITDQIKGLK